MKRYLMHILCSIVFCLGVLPVLQAGTPDKQHEELLQRADSLLAKYKDTEALKIYEEVLELSADHHEALCKASLLHVRIGNRFTDDTHKGEHFNKSKAYALRAYVLNPADAEANYLMALSLTNIAMLSGPKQKFALSKEVKTFLDAALTSNETHDKAWHLLGRWQYKMANLNFAEVAASKIFLASQPQVVTTEQAIFSISKAIELNPLQIHYYFDLASIYLDMKDRESCINALERALQLNLETKEELELSRRCKILLDEQLKKEQALQSSVAY